MATKVKQSPIKKAFKSGLKVTVATKINQNVQKALSMYEEQAVDYVNRVVNEFTNQVKKSMLPPKSGEVYENSKGETSQRSARGEAPAIDSSRLVNSVVPVFARKGNPVGRIEAGGGSKLAYGVKLEKFMDRPFMNKKSVANKNTRKYMKAISKQMSIKGKFKPATISGSDYK